MAYTPDDMRRATFIDDTETVQKFLNAVNKYDSTPLHWAVVGGNPARVQKLLDAGADLNAVDNDGSTPLHIAARARLYLGGENPAIVQKLLDAGADLNAVDNDGSTPLHIAARGCLYLGEENPAIVAIVQKLLDAGADLNAVDNDGRTPLHWAAQGKTGVATVLLKAGANPNASAKDGRKPKDLATNGETVQVLQAAGREQRGPINNVPVSEAWDSSTVAGDKESRPRSERTAAPLSGLRRHKLSLRKLSLRKEKHMPTMSIIGEPGSGKSHFATLLYIHLQNHPELSVYCDFENAEWNTINNAANLVRGVPLEPTPSDGVVHDVLNVSWSETTEAATRWWPWAASRQITSEKTIRIPVLDSSGELLQIAMEDILRTKGRITLRELEDHVADRSYSAELVAQLYNNVFHADRFCFIIDLARDVKQRRGTHAEVKHAAFLQNLKNFREANNLPAILDSMLVFTKYDAASKIVEEFLRRNSDGRSPDGTMVAHNRAPTLMAQLASLPGGNKKDPEVILSSTEWRQPPMTEDEIRSKHGENISEEDRTGYLEGEFDTRLLQNGAPVPVYAEGEYEKIVDWLKALI